MEKVEKPIGDVLKKPQLSVCTLADTLRNIMLSGS
jgi:hypothetical protein